MTSKEKIEKGMNKSLMISIRPEHAVNILNGKKTLELRTWIPKDYKGWVYVYVTKTIRDYKMSYYYQPKNQEKIYRLHGVIPFRFWFDEYDTLTYEDFWDRHDYIANDGEVGWEVDSDYIKLFCLDYQDILDYGFREKPYRNQVDLYAWHIKKLEIFDTPKELSHFYKYDKKWSKHYKTWWKTGCYDELNKFRLKKAPQRSVWVYTKELENDK